MGKTVTPTLSVWGNFIQCYTERSRRSLVLRPGIFKNKKPSDEGFLILPETGLPPSGSLPVRLFPAAFLAKTPSVAFCASYSVAPLVGFKSRFFKIKKPSDEGFLILPETGLPPSGSLPVRLFPAAFLAKTPSVAFCAPYSVAPLVGFKPRFFKIKKPSDEGFLILPETGLPPSGSLPVRLFPAAFLAKTPSVAFCAPYSVAPLVGFKSRFFKIKKPSDEGFLILPETGLEPVQLFRAGGF